MKKNNFCIATITYFPEESTINNIKKLCNINIDLIIVDNTPNLNNKYVEYFSCGENIHFFSNKKNTGVSNAIKQILAIGNQYSYDSVLYLDQDTFLKIKIPPKTNKIKGNTQSKTVFLLISGS